MVAVTSGPSRRRLLALLGSGATTGLAGCSLFQSTETETETEPTPDTPAGTVALELPDGTAECLDPVEGDQSVAEYYAFDADDDRSANLPAELLVNDATVTFVYRNTATDERSLVVVNGNPDSEAEADGVAPMTFEGVDGAEWLVQDGPPDAVPYTTASGTIDGPEMALWNWPANRTDGGVIGPLGEGFDVTVTHQASGTVRDTTMERTGVDRWFVADGADLGEFVEVASFDGGGDVSLTIADGCQ